MEEGISKWIKGSRHWDSASKVLGLFSFFVCLLFTCYIKMLRGIVNGVIHILYIDISKDLYISMAFNLRVNNFLY